MIHAIVYDAVGTLIHVQPTVAAIYQDVGRRFGSQLGSDEIQKRFPIAFAKQDRFDSETSWRTSEVREQERWCAIVGHVLDDVSDSVGCFDELFKAFGMPSAWRCDPDGANLLANLHQRGIRQALASNYDSRLRAVLAPMPIAPYLEAIVISSEIGWRKPAPEFFAHVATTLQLPPEAILFVGDDRNNDYEGARRAGMQGLLLDPRKKHLELGADRMERLGDLIEAFSARLALCGG